MGSPCELAIFAGHANDARRAFEAVTRDVDRLEARYSRYRGTSLLSEINRVAERGGALDVDHETAGLLDYAATCFQASGGLFDVTSGLLRNAWDFSAGALAQPEAIEALLPRVGWDKLRWEPPHLRFCVPGMELDLGGVVKEYASDRAAALCREAGVRSGFVNLGGDIAIIGPRPDRDAWRIGLAHPRKAGEMMTTLELERGAVATSGDYERCIVIDGRRYGHILNPKTGRPVSHLAAVTVVGDLCVVAGSASTIGMLKEVQGPAWLEALGLPHLWVDVEGTVGGPLGKPSRH
ncbi:MAG TPA: FAD:protein FMN transferase [Casimicrobiaceae bacterium]|nr:FAD:protein FMN transferase [Casimicrobiaceae bacterium]